MAVIAVDPEWRKVLKYISAAFAALMTIPGSMWAQAQKMAAGDWLMLTPADPRSPIVNNKTAVTLDSAGSTTVSIERRIAPYRSRDDSVAGARALEASKRDERLKIVVSLDERQLYVISGQDTVMTAPVAIGNGTTLVHGDNVWRFDTPRGIRTVRGKNADPLWQPP